MASRLSAAATTNLPKAIMTSAAENVSRTTASRAAKGRGSHLVRPARRRTDRRRLPRRLADRRWFARRRRRRGECSSPRLRLTSWNDGLEISVTCRRQKENILPGCCTSLRHRSARLPLDALCMFHHGSFSYNPLNCFSEPLHMLPVGDRS